ncbi:MAG: hypothetical protein WEA77_10955 [Hyphomonas sp.]
MGIALRVKGLRRVMTRVTTPVCPVCICFLNTSGIRQEYLAEFLRQFRAENRLLEALLHECRQVTGVVQMSMGQDHAIKVSRVNAKRLPVFQAQLLVTLKKSAIDEQLRLPLLNQKP